MSLVRVQPEELASAGLRAVLLIMADAVHGVALASNYTAEVRALARNTRSRRTRQLAIAAGTGAAARMRKAINRAGRGTCARCGISYLASALDVDHIHPLHKGGEDVESNIQPLCKYVCHAHKTRSDCGYAPLSF